MSLSSNGHLNLKPPEKVLVTVPNDRSCSTAILRQNYMSDKNNTAIVKCWLYHEENHNADGNHYPPKDFKLQHMLKLDL